MLGKRPGDKVSFSLWSDTCKTNQDNACVDEALAEDKFAKVFVRSQQEGIGVAAFKKHGLIVNSRIKLATN